MLLMSGESVKYIRTKNFYIALLPLIYVWTSFVRFRSVQWFFFLAFMSILGEYYSPTNVYSNQSRFLIHSLANVCCFSTSFVWIFVLLTPICIRSVFSNPFHIALWKMEFSNSFTTVRHAHSHMQPNQIDFSLFVFNVVNKH